MALIDFRGFRLIAQALLPIDKSTLRYGSDDGGVTFHNHPDLDNIFRQYAAFLVMSVKMVQIKLIMMLQSWGEAEFEAS